MSIYGSLLKSSLYRLVKKWQNSAHIVVEWPIMDVQNTSYTWFTYRGGESGGHAPLRFWHVKKIIFVLLKDLLLICSPQDFQTFRHHWTMHIHPFMKYYLTDKDFFPVLCRTWFLEFIWRYWSKKQYIVNLLWNESTNFTQEA